MTPASAPGGRGAPGETAEIGVFGGSGFYSFLDDAVEVTLDTPYGPPAAPVTIGDVGGRRVAFLPRHGRRHELPPHRINYRANLWAMRELGVSRLIGPCAAGSLQPEVAPGDFVVPDQLVDRTSGRADTFYEGPVAHHVSYADPYCAELSAVAAETARAAGITVHPSGTVVVIQGPRFSTRAESRWYRGQGFEVINMTQYPEAYLARELGICYTAIALITDYDTGVEGEGIEPVTQAEVFGFFKSNLDRVRALLFDVIAAVPDKRTCRCGEAVGPLE
ncbi:MAG TPA: S-methyl-5'-thioadenosine phosphorylase [Acidimicrobiia bacterium]|nr:S-methyl-5'-thioadenosine phosphorylase [Acidimicrobiia bacterium]